MLLYASCADMGLREYRKAVQELTNCHEVDGSVVAKFYGYDNDDDAVFGVEGDVQEWVLHAAKHGLVAVYPIAFVDTDLGKPETDLFVVTGERLGWRILNEKAA